MVVCTGPAHDIQSWLEEAFPESGTSLEHYQQSMAAGERGVNVYSNIGTAPVHSCTQMPVQLALIKCTGFQNQNQTKEKAILVGGGLGGRCGEG